jgi:hypothetical protein
LQKYKLKNVNILYECKELIDVNELSKASVENKFQKYVKDDAIMHLLL